MKNTLKPITVLFLIMSMSACRDNGDDTITYTEEISLPIFTDTSDEASVVSDSEEDTVDNEEHYRYAPPQDVLDIEFYCDRIEAEIVFESITEDLFGSPDAICAALPERVPEDIADVLLRLIADPPYFPYFSNVELRPVDVLCFEYDLNLDESVDYLFNVQMIGFTDQNIMWSPPYYHFEIAFVSQGSEYVCVGLPVYQNVISVPKYVLSSQTNGLKDLMVFHNSNKPALQYDGLGTYGNAVEIDEKHTFLSGEIISDNILHLNMNLSVIDRSYEEYCVAVKFAENPYLKNNLLYTSYPDGTPRSYSKKDDVVSFSPSTEGYDFYIELNDDAVANGFDADWLFHYLDLLEIKYIAVQ